MADYWDIDDFLAGEEQVNITSIKPELVEELVDSDSYSNNRKVLVPLWLAETLESRDLSQVLIPSYLSSAFLETQLACPELMNLPHFSGNFYYLASRLMDKDPALVKVLPQMFLARVKKMLKFVALENPNKEVLKSSCFESLIFYYLQKNALEKSDWKGRKHEKVAKTFTSGKPSRFKGC
jgi:hypothetical protein